MPTDDQRPPMPTDDQCPPVGNTSVWDELKLTNPKATKPFKKAGGFSGTQIDAAWRMQRMTEVFGPVGLGWGYDILERWREDFSVTTRDGTVLVKTCAFVRARVWAQHPQTGQTMVTGEQIGGTEAGLAADEIWKMSITDAVGKCMLQLGLSADIYLGMFDDSKYREGAEVFYANKANPDLQPAAIEKFEAELKERLADVTGLDALDDLWRGGANARIREIGTVDKAAQNRMITYFSQKKNELLKREESGDRAA